MNVAPLWRAYEEGSMDFFQVAEVLATKLRWSAEYVRTRYARYCERRANREQR